MDRILLKLRYGVWASLTAVAILVLLSPPAIDGQVLYGSLVGNIKDASGAAVPEAMVTVTSKETGLSREAAAGPEGYFNVTTLPPGTYDVRVSKPGFSSLVREGIVVSADNISRADATLQVGAVTEAVTVSGQAAALQTDHAEVRAEMTSAVMENLPVPPGRNFQGLLKILPGFSPPTNGNSLAADPLRNMLYNVNGASQSSNNFKVDGAGVNGVWLPHNSGYIPTLEALETVTVVSNSMDAGLGLAGGAAVSVNMKTGTNALHGSVFEYNNNNATQGRPYFEPADFRKPKVIYNQFGATLGGPIKKDKLFYFVAYEGTLDRRFAETYATVPTAAMRSGDMSATPADSPIYDPLTGDSEGSGKIPFAGNIVPQSRINPIAAKLVSLTPTSNIDAGPELYGDYYAGGNYRFNRHKLDSKVNWNATDKLTMFARLGYLKYDGLSDGIMGQLGGSALYSAATVPSPLYGSTYSGTLSASYTLAPNFVVDGYFGYTLIDTNQAHPHMDQNLGLALGIPGTNGTRSFEGGYPWFGFDDFDDLGGANATRPLQWHDPRQEYVANSNWLKGTHNLRFGFYSSRQQMNHVNPNMPGISFPAAGGFYFTGQATTINDGVDAANQYNNYADFLLGLPSSLGKTFQVPDELTTRVWLHSLYAADQWQISPRLTLSYGIRWEYFPMPTRADRGLELYNLQTNTMGICGLGNIPKDCGVQVSKRSFAPRFGIAWRATDTFVVRAGYGITNDPYSLARPMEYNYPNIMGLEIDSPNSYTAAGNLSTGIPAVQTPDLSSGSVSIPGNIAANTLPAKFDRGYIQSWNVSLQRKLPWGFTGQAAYVATRQVRQTGFAELNYGIPGGGQASRILNQTFGRTASTLLVSPLGTSHYDALQTSLEHRFSAGLSLNVNYTFSKSIGIAGAPNSDGTLAIPIPQDYALNRSLSSFDRTHNLEISTVAELPFGKGKPFAGHGIAAVVAGGWQVNAIVSAYTGSPFTVTASSASLNAPGSSQHADQVKPDVQILGETGPGQSWFDPLAFAPVHAARFGTSGFNILRGPGVFNMDLGLFRDFRLSERFKLQFRAEGFNSTNTPHFANPGSNRSAMILNPNGAIAALNGYTEITSTNSIGRDGIDERQIRFGVKISF